MSTPSDLYLALEAVNYREMSRLPSLQDLEGFHEFSERHQKRIARIIRRHKRRYLQSTDYTVRKAWIAAAVLILALSLSMSVEASRKAIIRFVIEIFEEYSEVGYRKADVSMAPKIIMEVREPEWGDEYEEVERVRMNPRLTVRQSHIKKRYEIIFKQRTLSENEDNVNTENTDIQEIELLEGYIAYYLKDGNDNVLYWSDGEYSYRLQGACSIKELIRLANSIK